MGPTHKCTVRLKKKRFDDVTLIWLDRSIARTDDNYYSMKRLCNLFNNIRTFSRIDGFINYLNDGLDEKIILVVSGSLGEEIIPKIHSFHLIDSIYIFCQNKTKHQLWAKDYSKIQGVYNDIDTLRLYLIKSKLFQSDDDYYPNKKESSSKDSSALNFIEHLIEPDYSNEEIKDEFMSYYYTENQALPVSDIIDQDQDSCYNKDENIDSFLIYFSSNDKVGKVDLENDVAHSNTVTPFVSQNDHQYEDYEVFPKLWWITKNENDFSKMVAFNKIRHLVVNIKVIESVDMYLRLLKTDSNQEHFIVICDSENLDGHLTSICLEENVRRVYLHSPLSAVGQYRTIIKRYSRIISVLQHSDSLAHMILHDFMFYLIKRAQFYQKENKINLAKIRYEYALQFQSYIQMFIKERINLINKN